MNTLKTLLVSSALAMAAGGWAIAQDSSEPFQLPEQCSTEAAGMNMAEGGSHGGHGGHGGGMDMDGMDMGMMGMEGMDIESLPDFQRENMEKMMISMPAMHQGMMHPDPDVAFACGMIAHHQGAIDMAQVQLEYGEDEWLRELAQEIITAQEAEIAEMTEWLAENAAE